MKKAAILLLLLCTAVFCACSAEVASEKEIIKFAKDTYGKADFLYSEQVSEDALRCYFTDKEYGFTYHVSSNVLAITIDGAVFGYKEDKGSDFNDVFYEYIRTQSSASIAALSQQYSCEILLDDIIYDNVIYVDITSPNTDNACIAAEKTREILSSYDTRGYWENISCRVYDANGNKQYTYDTLHEQPLTPEDEDIEFFTQAAQMKHSEAQYLRKDTRLFSQTGITEDKLVNILGTEPPTSDSIITYYYFTAEGKEFFLADVQVYYPDYSSMSWHTNYLEVFGE